ncbi:hypothetical protein QYF36_021908 [Acer negundo]|nr:hypothetical protein QYF36_021908 [Acer negundo]
MSLSQDKYLRDIRPVRRPTPWGQPSHLAPISRDRLVLPCLGLIREAAPAPDQFVQGGLIPLALLRAPAHTPRWNQSLASHARSLGKRIYPACYLGWLKRLAYARTAYFSRLTDFALPWAHQGSGSSPRPVCIGWPNPSRNLASSRTHSPSGTNPPPAMPNVRKDSPSLKGSSSTGETIEWGEA